MAAGEAKRGAGGEDAFSNFAAQAVKDFRQAAALAQSLAAAHRAQEAVRVVDAARNGAGTDADLLYTISGLYLRVGGKQGSEEALKQVLKLDPQYAEAQSNLGVLYGQQGRNSEAEQFFRQATENNPRYTQAFVNLGLTLAT